MPRKIPKSLFDAKLLPLWRDSKRFTAHPLRVAPTGGKSKHFSGGPAPHAGSKCPECKQKLTLLWDLDLTDPLIPDYAREGFSPCTRLPLYICWQCVTASYAVTSDARLKCFPFDHHSDYLEEGETPFPDAPLEMPRRPIALQRIPSTLDALASLANVIGLNELDKPARVALDQSLSTKLSTDWDLPFSQFGGQPLVSPRRGDMVCPNPKCPANELTHPYGEMQRPYLMKEMALIQWRDEPILAEHCFQLLYFICGICFSMRAEYRCS
ncbi:MAG: hypothetical protein JWN70_1025 [Planctomycetaceae bacterium]|nr:hypothetical protein [Planctomycetaceae bacterium]